MRYNRHLCPSSDLFEVIERSRDDLDSLRGARVFLTGGTGFIGKWLLATIALGNDQLGLGINTVVLCRDPERFRREHPVVSGFQQVSFVGGDIRSFEFPPGKFSHVIHGATAASAKLNVEDPLLMIDTIGQGTLHLLRFAAQSGSRVVLSLSSGAVYGRQPDEMVSIPETYLGGPDPCDRWSAYGEGKRLSELYGTLVSGSSGFDHKIARIFAQVGPWLPLDTHYAIGNFIGDALKGGPIKVGGDGQPLRSYLYSTDLVTWLLRILVKGKGNHPYNVGSDRAVSIASVAENVRALTDQSMEIQVARKSMPGQRGNAYIPCLDRARNELRLDVTVNLEEGIRRTIDWNRERLREQPA
jgi:nucleoside-diphosphate-sugar epimerase